MITSICFVGGFNNITAVHHAYAATVSKCNGATYSTTSFTRSTAGDFYTWTSCTITVGASFGLSSAALASTTTLGMSITGGSVTGSVSNYIDIVSTSTQTSAKLSITVSGVTFNTGSVLRVLGPFSAGSTVLITGNTFTVSQTSAILDGVSALMVGWADRDLILFGGCTVTISLNTIAVPAGGVAAKNGEYLRVIARMLSVDGSTSRFLVASNTVTVRQPVGASLVYAIAVTAVGASTSALTATNGGSIVVEKNTLTWAVAAMAGMSRGITIFAHSGLLVTGANSRVSINDNTVTLSGSGSGPNIYIFDLLGYGRFSAAAGGTRFYGIRAPLQEPVGRLCGDRQSSAQRRNSRPAAQLCLVVNGTIAGVNGLRVHTNLITGGSSITATNNRCEVRTTANVGIGSVLSLSYSGSTVTIADGSSIVADGNPVICEHRSNGGAFLLLLTPRATLLGADCFLAARRNTITVTFYVVGADGHAILLEGVITAVGNNARVLVEDNILTMTSSSTINRCPPNPIYITSLARGGSTPLTGVELSIVRNTQVQSASSASNDCFNAYLGTITNVNAFTVSSNTLRGNMVRSRLLFEAISVADGGTFDSSSNTLECVTPSTRTGQFMGVGGAVTFGTNVKANIYDDGGGGGFVGFGVPLILGHSEEDGFPNDVPQHAVVLLSPPTELKSLSNSSSDVARGFVAPKADVTEAGQPHVPNESGWWLSTRILWEAQATTFSAVARRRDPLTARHFLQRDCRSLMPRRAGHGRLRHHLHQPYLGASSRLVPPFQPLGCAAGRSKPNFIVAVPAVNLAAKAPAATNAASSPLAQSMRSSSSSAFSSSSSF